MMTLVANIFFLGSPPDSVVKLLKKWEDRNKFEYKCPKCGNGNVVAEMYGSYDQFEEGKCTTCDYKYDGFTEDFI